MCGCTAALEDHPVWSLNEPTISLDVTTNFKDANGEQNCIFHEKNDWRQWIAWNEYGRAPSSGYWCADASPETDPHTDGPAETAEHRAMLCTAAGGLDNA